MYLIWSFEHDEWWAPARQGYTKDFHRAGRYSADDAGEIVTSSIFNDEVAVLEACALRDGSPKFHPYHGPGT